MLRNLRPDITAQQQHYQQQVMRLHNGNMHNGAMMMKGNQLQRTAMANNHKYVAGTPLCYF